MQEELEAGKTLEETAAGSVLSAEMSALIKKHEEEMMKLREEMEEANKARDKAWQKELNDELAGLKKDVQRLIAGIGQLKQPPYVRFFRPVHDFTKRILYKFVFDDAGRSRAGRGGRHAWWSSARRCR
jgi:hypothetical protein